MDWIQYYIIARFSLPVLVTIITYNQPTSIDAQNLLKKHPVCVELLTFIIASPYFGRVLGWW